MRRPTEVCLEGPDTRSDRELHCAEIGHGEEREGCFEAGAKPSQGM